MKTLSTNLNVRTLVFSALLGLISITSTPTATHATQIITEGWLIPPPLGFYEPMYIMEPGGDVGAGFEKSQYAPSVMVVGAGALDNTQAIQREPFLKKE